MLDYLNEGFAVAGGDSGHLASENNDGDGAPNTYLPYLHDRDQVLAWIHNSIALFTPPAREFVKAYYGRDAAYSYYYGCSTGGAQGFALSQLHPGLFDGIYAGCPGFWYSHLALSFLWNGQRTQGDAYLSQSLLDTVTSAVLDQCDELDGVADRLLENPLACNFSIDALACDAASSNTSACLTPAQLDAAKAIYAGPKDIRDGSAVYPGFSVGSETEWAQGQEGSLAEAFSIPILQNLVYDNLSYDSSTFDWGSNIDDVDDNAGVFIDETSTDLTAFREAGGKMLVSQGWADPYNAAALPIEYLEQLQSFFGGDVSDFFNVFMVPGGGHCGGASSYPSVPAKHRVIAALQAWVELGIKPETAVRAARPAAFRAPIAQRRGYAEAAADKIKLTLALPHQTIFKSSEVVQVNLSSESGDMGVLANHVPSIEQLKPGLIEVIAEQGGSKQWFASGGFAIVQPDNQLSVNAVEAYPLEDFSIENVRNQIAEAQKVASGSGSEVDIAEAQIELEVLESLQAALK
ncbi:tannase and feruloyl esterase [Neofusicoccum parvum]|uniref:Tannase and feruloyl esterase n=1 Tax=Neofusicoccum parvum TaxID=310453 RepID=A0ACB5RX94_9PEZI|nr:tannase and feruloyl esterase [Neofusicoccum parvum]